jgi:hypothetical protein
MGLASCDGDNEVIDPALNNTIGGNNPGDNNNPGGVTASNDYWPTALNNKWVMKENGTNTYTLKFNAVETFNGLSFYRFDPITNTVGGASVGATTWLNKSNGVYTQKTGAVAFDVNGVSGTVSGFDIVILKENLPVAGTWTGSYQQIFTYSQAGVPSVTQTVQYTGKITEKNVSAVVNNVTYNDVIKVNIVETVSASGITTSEVEKEYWFAKNIGPIKIIHESDFGDFETVLIDYTLY